MQNNLESDAPIIGIQFGTTSGTSEPKKRKDYVKVPCTSCRKDKKGCSGTIPCEYCKSYVINVRCKERKS